MDDIQMQEEPDYKNYSDQIKIPPDEYSILDDFRKHDSGSLFCGKPLFYGLFGEKYLPVKGHFVDLREERIYICDYLIYNSYLFFKCDSSDDIPSLWNTYGVWKMNADIFIRPFWANMNPLKIVVWIFYPHNQ